ncbi:hypothetical protein BA92_12755 [Sanguibacteroides justesenii]|uniref:Teneurin-like YD-shell domain-containing protein n=1 Tax=Sanguibacteroides justesenii TaxID=1547597 RepID=A0A0C3MA84_9PORP|nr:hypothetical protein BA92_12755 [Sanguibacteroides justesenii]
MNFEYNVLNLLSAVKSGTTLKASYTYLADGTKLRVADASGNGFYYSGSLTHVKNSAGIQLEGATTASGRVLVGTGSRTGNDIRYFLTDHLGSVRSVVDQTGTVKERNDYYPFGTRYSQSGGNVDPANRLKYNGKEDQTTGNLGFLDYGARMYDAELGRWFCVDPMSESYYSLSSYNYCANNPILFIDPNGMWLGDPPAFIKGWNGRINEFNNDFFEWLNSRSGKPSLLLNDLSDFSAGILNFLTDISGISNFVTGQNKTAEALGSAIQTISKIPSMSGEELGSFTASSVLFLGEFAVNRKLPLGKSNSIRKASKLPTQIHHFATNKNKMFTPQMKKIAEQFGLDLNGDWNKAVLPHLGRHPNDYHKFVLQNMEKARLEANGNQVKFLQLFDQYVKAPLLQNPDLLRKGGW